MYWTVHCKNSYIGKQVGNIHNGYREVTIRIEGKKNILKIHRAIWILHNGDIPEGYSIDHIDQNSLNNDINNLRLATHAQNCCNRSRSNSTGVKGLTKRASGRYSASICVKGKTYWVGTFDTKEEAKEKLDKERERLHGEFFNNLVKKETNSDD